MIDYSSLQSGTRLNSVERGLAVRKSGSETDRARKSQLDAGHASSGTQDTLVTVVAADELHPLGEEARLDER